MPGLAVNDLLDGVLGPGEPRRGSRPNGEAQRGGLVRCRSAVRRTAEGGSPVSTTPEIGGGGVTPPAPVGSSARSAGGVVASRRLAAGGCLVLALLLAWLVVPDAAPARAAATPTAYTFSQQFAVGNTGNMQGLAFAGGTHYVSFDLGGGQGRIVAYDAAGRELQRTGPLPLGHANEMSVRPADGLLYVLNSDASPSVVDVVDMGRATPVVVRTIPVGKVTHGAVVGMNIVDDQLVLVTGPTGGPYDLVVLDMTGHLLRSVGIPDQGVTQGVEVVDGQVLLYTSLSNPARNQITVLSMAGAVLRVIPVPVASEGEGLSADPATDQVYIGANSPNRVLAMSPRFVAEPVVSTQSLTLDPVADTMARQQGDQLPAVLGAESG